MQMYLPTFLGAAFFFLTSGFSSFIRLKNFQKLRIDTKNVVNQNENLPILDAFGGLPLPFFGTPLAIGSSSSISSSKSKNKI